jgi:SAM-dependent methyltransferase
MDKNLKELITWKTNAWKAKDMASTYAGRMAENSSINHLKNAVEVGLIEKFVVGSEVLDVGIGTGRASYPLLKKGLQITGVDSSQAMLDECKRLAGALPIQLHVGDICALPFPAGRFDSLISLNVMTHFPHWREVLSEWRRVVKPAGRIIFDIYSIDHLNFVEGRTVTLNELVERGGASSFSMYVSAAEIFEFADEAGLRVISITPYGGVFASQYRRFNAEASLNTLNWWKRQLEWLSVDESLFDAALFMERNLFACLTSKTTGRFMVVLENQADPIANKILSDRLKKINSVLEGKVTLESLAPYLLIPADIWKEEFSRHMGPLRNRVLAYHLLSSFLGRPDAIDFASFFGNARGAELDDWLKQEQFGWSNHKGFEDMVKILGFESNLSRLQLSWIISRNWQQFSKDLFVGLIRSLLGKFGLLGMRSKIIRYFKNEK